MSNTTSPTNSRKRKTLQEDEEPHTSSTSSAGWVAEYGALEQQDRQSPILEKPSTTTSTSQLYKSSPNHVAITTDYTPQFILISTSRLERLLRCVQNVPRDVAIHVLESVEDYQMYNKHSEEFLAWNMSHVVEQLRSVFNSVPDRNMVDGLPPMKRMRTSYYSQVEQEREFVRQRVTEHLEKLRGMKSTSFDDLVLSIVESFRYHPTTAFKLLQSALEKNRHNYVLYFHAMELYRQTGSKLDCVKELQYGRFIIHDEIAQVEVDLSVESSRNCINQDLIDTLEKELSVLKSLNRIFDGLIHFFSDGSAEDMFHLFSDAVKFDPNSAHAYTNLGVLNAFNINGSSETCLQGIQMLEKALETCGAKDHLLLAAFLYHSIAQSYMRLGRTEDALYNIDRTLEVNPTMILAYFDKASILRSQNDLTGALIENDALLQICPENPFELSNIYCNRAVLHYKLRQEKAMYESLNKSMSIDPCNSFPYIMMSKQAILGNDRDTFQMLKDKMKPSEHMHIIHYLQHLIEAYSHFDNDVEMKKHQTLLTNYEESWNRID